MVGLILARAGSKSVPRKNIRPLAGRPMIAYTVEEARKSRYLSRVILSTESPEIADLGRELGAEAPFLRPPELAEDHVQDLPVVLYFLDWMRREEGQEPDILVQLRPTSPLRRAEHIDQAIELLVAHPEAHSVRSVFASAVTTLSRSPREHLTLRERIRNSAIASEAICFRQVFASV